jgi:hypothetical protein
MAKLFSERWKGLRQQMQRGKERTEILTMMRSLAAAEVPTIGCRGGHVISNNALNTGWCIAYA